MKQLIILFSTLLIVSLSACGNNSDKKETNQSSVEYETYHNQHYNYSVEYPNFLISQEESDNGDGQKFLSEDERIKLLVYRDYKNDYLTEGKLYTLEEAFQNDLNLIEGVFNKTLKNNYYFIEHKAEDILYSQYAQLRNDDYLNILFQYPQEEKEMMKDIVEQVIESLKADVYSTEKDNNPVGELEYKFLAFIKEFLNDCYWGKNFNKLLRDNNNILATYIDSKMDIRRYYAPGTISILASRSEGFGFDDYTDFETKPKTNSEEVFELIATDENPCMLNTEGNSKIYYQWIETVPELLVDMETFETEQVGIIYPNAQMMAIYLPNAYNNPVGYYFIYTPNGWKLAFVDDTLCGA
ncbi:MAG: hypothetical protein GX921_01535 [Bacteroidales bacterium]|nr:hypothetical protein [Bacteroidales bacterium]